MTALLLAAQFLVTIAMIGTILLQRSEGGALGLGGGGGVSGLMSGRGAANALSRMTVFLGAAFIAISLALAMIAKANSHGTTIAPGVSGVPGQIPVLPGSTPPSPTPAPSGTTPAAPTGSGSAPATAPAVPAVPVPSTPAPATPAAPASGGH